MHGDVDNELIDLPVAVRMDTPEELEDFEEDVAFNIVNLERRLAGGQISDEKAVSAAVSTVRRISSEVISPQFLNFQQKTRGGFAPDFLDISIERSGIVGTSGGRALSQPAVAWCRRRAGAWKQRRGE